MNDDIIRMAREAGLHLPYWDEEQDPEKDPPHWAMVSPLPRLLARFADLVRAAEQDRCCRIIYGMAGSDNVAQRTVDAIRSKSC